MMMIKERADKDIFMYNIEIKELERIIAHECRLKEYMSTKCYERSGQDDTQDTGPSQCKCSSFLSTITVFSVGEMMWKKHFSCFLGCK